VRGEPIVTVRLRPRQRVRIGCLWRDRSLGSWCQPGFQRSGVAIRGVSRPFVNKALTHKPLDSWVFHRILAWIVNTEGASGVSAFGGGWGRRIWRVGCEFRAGFAGSLWRRTAARIPKGAGQNGSMFRLRLEVGIWRLPGQWHPAKVSTRGDTLAAGWRANQIAAAHRRPSGWWGLCPKSVGFGPGGLCQDGAGPGVQD
jgi:hypothetical protein